MASPRDGFTAELIHRDTYRYRREMQVQDKNLVLHEGKYEEEGHDVMLST